MDFRRLLREERQRALQRKSQGDETAAPTENEESASNDEKAAEAELSNEPLTGWRIRPQLDLTQFRVDGIRSVYYVPEWLTQEEEDAILGRVYGAPATMWVSLKRRRLQMYGGQVKAPFSPEPLPLWLTQIASGLVDAGVFVEATRPNHALINEYGVGEGIMPHEDGPAYHPMVAIISTGADARVTFAPHRKWTAETPDVPDTALTEVSFMVRRRSLLLFTEDAYTEYLHSIDGVELGKRVSLTIRHVHVAPSA
ncbi:hypothetical protein Poli38472_014520 [Pythium oligandrum]|uniref:Fe2OG dioxygenase domain-containing protein n=1 Tax=Pythium oligandrum TaxID=41045 RepID=A0A8K1CCV7_PYTOL|nr:hypothetical protein Poli38472_014520 [Pythium oligandrum]|eukprot:TMW61059.1 hypothetical protein Poli38472_014520 [Pythium oligandrum]